eukprot:4006755-Alexandrium_andersonii.AAC.1
MKPGMAGDRCRRRRTHTRGVPALQDLPCPGKHSRASAGNQKTARCQNGNMSQAVKRVHGSGVDP